jgi:hypothetical protein
MTRLAGAAALITALTIVARIAGFGRTLVFFYTVGEDGLADLYFAANLVPNIVFELVAGGALASLVVPLLAGAVADGDRDRVHRVTSALLTWVLLLTVPLAVAVFLTAGPISGLLDGIPPEHQEIAARMLRIFAPQLPLYGVGIVLTGVLQAHHRFAWPVIAPLLSSATVMTAYLAYAVIDGPRTGFAGLSRAGELILSVGTTLGVVVLSLCLVIPVARLRLRIRPSLRFPGDEGRQAVRLGWAGAVTVGAQQVVAALIVVLAAREMAHYTGAQTVFLLPWAVLAVPLATAVYPRLAASFSGGDAAGYAARRAGHRGAGWAGDSDDRADERPRRGGRGGRVRARAARLRAVRAAVPGPLRARRDGRGRGGLDRGMAHRRRGRDRGHGSAGQRDAGVRSGPRQRDRHDGHRRAAGPRGTPARGPGGTGRAGPGGAGRDGRGGGRRDRRVGRGDRSRVAVRAHPGSARPPR